MNLEEKVHLEFSTSMLVNGCKYMKKRPDSFKLDVKAESDTSGKLVLSLIRPINAIERIVKKIIEGIDGVSMSICKVTRTRILIEWSLECLP